VVGRTAGIGATSPLAAVAAKDRNPPMADLHRGPSGQRGGEMPTKLTAEPIVGASPPIAPASTSPAPPASGRSRRRRSCGVAEGKPAGRRGAAGHRRERYSPPRRTRDGTTWRAGLPRVSCGPIDQPAARGEVGELRYFCGVMRGCARARVYGRKAGNFTNFTTRREGPPVGAADNRHFGSIVGNGG
jgi:hypothetical protein